MSPLEYILAALILPAVAYATAKLVFRAYFEVRSEFINNLLEKAKELGERHGKTR